MVKLVHENLQIKLRSPQTNSAFQKLFALPPEEFLINDFACHLKRRMPLQVIVLDYYWDIYSYLFVRVCLFPLPGHVDIAILFLFIYFWLLLGFMWLLLLSCTHRI